MYKVGNKRDECLLLLIISTLFIIGMLLISGFTSPLYPNYWGGDSALFTMIGKGMNEGKIVYKDLFDHKGPILFFIEDIGYSIAGRTGIWLLQCVFGLINIFYIYATWKIANPDYSKLRIIDICSILIATFSIFFYTFERGNLSEEYSLPIISACVYYFVKYSIKADKQPKHNPRYALIYGIGISLLAFIRINNTVTVCIIIFIYLFYKKEFKNLFLNILFGFIGCATVVIPIIIYFSSKSVLYDMFYATFLYNFSYAGNTAHQSILLNLGKYSVLYMPLVLSCILFTSYFIIKKETKPKIAFIDIIIGFIIIMNFICLIVANIYPHYFNIFLPVFSLVLIKYWKFNIKSTRTFLVLMCTIVNLCFVAYSFGATLYKNYITDNAEKRHGIIYNDINHIPENEKNSVIGYNISTDNYLIGDITPCYKYYTHQTWWSNSNPQIHKDFVIFLQDQKPLWLLTKPDEDNKEVLNVIKNNYELKYKNDYLLIYRINK